MTYQVENAFYDMRHVGNKYWIVTLHGRTVFRGLFHECMTWIDQQPSLFPTVTKGAKS